MLVEGEKKKLESSGEKVNSILQIKKSPSLLAARTVRPRARGSHQEHAIIIHLISLSLYMENIYKYFPTSHGLFACITKDILFAYLPSWFGCLKLCLFQKLIPNWYFHLLKNLPERRRAVKSELGTLWASVNGNLPFELFKLHTIQQKKTDFNKAV